MAVTYKGLTIKFGGDTTELQGALKSVQSTAKDKTDLGKSFDDWVCSFPQSEFDLEREGGWASDVMQIIKDNYFPNAKADVEAATAEASDAAASAGTGK